MIKVFAFTLQFLISKISKMFKKITLSVLTLFCFTTLLVAQVGIGTVTPDPGAMLDISGNGGILIPRIALTSTSSTVPISPPAPTVTPGVMVYNTATAGDVTPGFYYWNGAAWERMASGASTDWSLTGNAGTTPGTAAGENFIGTSDAEDLVIATDGAERMRIIENGRVGINQNNPIGFVQVTSPLAGDAPLGGPGIYSNISVTNSNWSAVEAFNPNTAGGTGVTGVGAFGVRGLGTIGVRGQGVFAVEGLGIDEGVYGQGLDGVVGFTTDIVAGWAGLFIGDVGVTNDLFVFGTINPPSDKRIKKNFRNIENALGTINALKPTLYEKNISIIRNKYDENSMPTLSLNTNENSKQRISQSGQSNNQTEYGLIAQEVELLLPDLVKEKKMNIEGLGEIDLKSVNYTGLIPILIQGIQEQQEIIDNQESRIAKLEAIVNELLNKK